MTNEQLKYIRKVLDRIKNPDQHIAKAIAYIEKDLAEYAARKGQLLDSYESENYPW